MEIVKLTQNQNSYQSSLCESIDDFLVQYDNDGRNLYSDKNYDKLPVLIDKPRTLEDAQSIVEIYNVIYEETYPYKEMLDPIFVYNTFQDPTYHWGIFRFKSQGKIQNKIVGCFTITIDYINKSGYMRGLNILPDYQGRINVRELSYGMIHRFCEQNKDSIDKWYNESRTAHNIVQYLSRQIGALPYAIYAGKDCFLKKKETDVLMVAYRRDALYNTRQPPKKIHHRVKPLHTRIAQYFNLEACQDHITNFNLAFNSKSLEEITNAVKINISEDAYGYKHFKFILESTGDFMKGLHTLSVNNIEKIQYQCSNVEVFSVFLSILENYIFTENIEYTEFHIDASNVDQIEILFRSEYLVSGYIPAWIKNEKNDKFKDIVVFSKHCIEKIVLEPKMIQDTQILQLMLKQINKISLLENEMIPHHASSLPLLHQIAY